MSDLVVAATDATFKSEVVDSTVPTLVDFWAPWCGRARACRRCWRKSPTSTRAAFKVVKVNTDVNQDVAMKHNVRSIPTVLLYKDGRNRRADRRRSAKRHFRRHGAKHL
jgi:thioredoxin 1